MFKDSGYFSFFERLIAYLLPFVLLTKIYLSIKYKQLRLLDVSLIVIYSFLIGGVYLLLNQSQRLYIGLNFCFALIIWGLFIVFTRVFNR